MNVNFRIATINDIKGIIDLCNECFEENTEVQNAYDVFVKNMYDPNQIYLIGELEGMIIAHCKITIIPTIYEKMGIYSILNHVCVNPKYRRHNIATHMLEECERISKEHGCKCMELWSNNVREAAHACYKHFGFVVNDAAFFSKEI